MKRILMVVVLLLGVALLAACAAPEAEQVEVTRLIEKEVEITKIVEGEVVVETVIETVVETVKEEVEVEVVVTATPEPVEEGLSPRHGGTLTVINRASPKSMVSIIDPGKTGIWILNNTQDGLLNRTADYSSVYPAIAADFPEVPDPLTYIFTLREGVMFHSGREVVAEDIVYTYERLLDESYGATFGAVYRTNIDSVEAADKYTVIFHLKQEWPIFLSFVGGNHPKVVNKDLAELPEYGISVWSGTGPFIITEWVQGDRITVVRNPDYFLAGEEQLPYLDGIVFKEIPDPSAMYAAFEAGQADVLTDPDFKDIQRYVDNPDYDVIVESSPASSLIVFNTGRPPFDNQALRQAISKGIDRQEIVDALFFGYAEAAGDFFPSFHWAHDPTIKAEYDPEEAVALLAEAGYNESNPFSFVLMSRTEPVYLDQAVLIQDQLGRIGIDVEVSPVEYTTLSGMTRGPSDEWAGDAALYRITPLRGTAFEFTYYQYGAEGGLNRCFFNKEGGFQDPEFEEKLLFANTHGDYDADAREAAIPLYAELSQMWLEDAPGIIMNWWANADMYYPYVRNWVPAVGDITDLREVYLIK